MDAYLASYTDWHKGKLDIVFSHMPKGSIAGEANLIDWGCGQGMASIYFLEYIRSYRINCRVREIILIDPCGIALRRAEFLLHRMDPSLVIRCLEKKLDDVHADEVTTASQRTTYHLFSNVLDLDGIDLKHLSQIVFSNCANDNFIICVSPYYNGVDIKLDRFFTYFKRPLAFEYYETQSNKLERGFTYSYHIAKLLANQPEQVIQYKFYPPVQFRAAYQLDMCGKACQFNEKWTYFDVYSPFDLGADIKDDVHPILAVLNNIISRGLPTKASPYIEECVGNEYSYEVNEYGEIRYDAVPFSAHVHGNMDIEGLLSYHYGTSEDDTLRLCDNPIINELVCSPLAVARLQKLLVEVLLTGRLSMDTDSWDVLVEEKDVPFAAIAFEDFRQMFDNLTSITTGYRDLKLPKINLRVITNSVYQDSPLHLGMLPYRNPDSGGFGQAV